MKKIFTIIFSRRDNGTSDVLSSMPYPKVTMIHCNLPPIPIHGSERLCESHTAIPSKVATNPHIHALDTTLLCFPETLHYLFADIVEQLPDRRKGKEPLLHGSYLAGLPCRLAKL